MEEEGDGKEDGKEKGRWEAGRQKGTRHKLQWELLLMSAREDVNVASRTYCVQAQPSVYTPQAGSR